MNHTANKLVQLGDKTFELSIPYKDLDAAIERLAARINHDYRGLETPLFVGVLNGAFMFFSELLQKIEFQCEVSFVKLSSYHGVASSGVVTELIGLKDNIRGRHVIIVEDIVDTGASVAHLMNSLVGHQPASVEIATMLFKPTAYREKYPIKYPALEIPETFIVGFGLDYNQLGRNLKDIYKLVGE
jgi:hypoxanthine phosphoribosyltransferase